MNVIGKNRLAEIQTFGNSPLPEIPLVYSRNPKATKIKMVDCRVVLDRAPEIIKLEVEQSSGCAERVLIVLPISLYVRWGRFGAMKDTVSDCNGVTLATPQPDSVIAYWHDRQPDPSSLR
jgi:hypothetical protein